MTPVEVTASPESDATPVARIAARVWPELRRFGIAMPMAGALAIVVLLAGFQQSVHPLAFVITIAMCLAAAVCSRWPVAGGVAVGVSLVILIFVPIDWVGVSVHAFLIPIVVAVIAGRSRLAVLWTVLYLAALAGITVRRVDPSDPSGLGAYLFSWVAMVGVAWVIAAYGRMVMSARETQRQLEAHRQRAAIARELHDGVARELTMISMRVERAREAGGAGDEDLTFISEASLDAQNGLRNMMALLRDTTDESVSEDQPVVELAATLARCRQRLETEGFTVNGSVSGDLEQVSGAVQTVLSRVAEEAVANIVRHAEPRSVVLMLGDIGPITTEIGFFNRPHSGIPAQEPVKRRSMGLIGVKERVEAVHGELRSGLVGSQWRVEVRVPSR